MLVSKVQSERHQSESTNSYQPLMERLGQNHNDSLEEHWKQAMFLQKNLKMPENNPVLLKETPLFQYHMKEMYAMQKKKQFHPWNLTWNLKMMVSKRNHLFRGLIFRFHVKFRGVLFFFSNGQFLRITGTVKNNKALSRCSSCHRHEANNWHCAMMGLDSVLPKPEHHVALREELN